MQTMPLLPEFYSFPESTSRYFIRTASTPLSPISEGFKEEYEKGFREKIETLNIKEDSDREYGEGTPNRKRKWGELNCKYSADVPTSFKKDVEKAAKWNLTKQKNMLGKWINYNRVCYNHIKALADHWGLQVKTLNHIGLSERLSKIWRKHDKIEKLKVDTTIYHWFRRSDRPPRPSDALDVFRFRATATPINLIVISQITDFILDYPDIKRRFEEEGNMNIPNVFS